MAGKDSGLGATVLGLEGFGLLAATGEDGELLMLVETDASVVGCSGLGNLCGVEGSAAGQGSGLAVGWVSGGVGVVQADMALPGWGMFGWVLVGDQPPCPTQGGADGTGPP